MSSPSERSQSNQEAFGYFRQDLDDLFKREVDRVVIVQDPKEMVLPAELFLGGQLEIETNLYDDISLIRSDVGKHQVTSLTFGDDEYMMTDERVFAVEDPFTELSDDDLDHLSWQFRNTDIIWSVGQSWAVARAYRKAGVSVMAKRDEYLRPKPKE
jgi:hypothetical protein